MMTGFDEAGTAQLLIVQGQQQIAATLIDGVGRLLAHVLGLLGRNLPDGNHAPW